MFTSGYLIPNLLPVGQSSDSTPWGLVGSRVRGTCYYYKANEHYGFMRFIKELGALWITDTREENSPYDTVYFNDAMFCDQIDCNGLPSRTKIFEFTLAQSSQHKDKLQAEDVSLVSELR
jgi:hypothetical protein